MSHTEKLPCDLTSYELRERATKMANVVNEIEQLELKKKVATDTAKREIDALVVSVSQLARQVRTGKEDREVEVEEVHDEIRFAVETFRTDTGEVVRSRPMTDEEKKHALQVALPGLGKTKRRRKTDADEDLLGARAAGAAFQKQAQDLADKTGTTVSQVWQGEETVIASPMRQPVVDDDERRRSFLEDKGSTTPPAEPISK